MASNEELSGNWLIAEYMKLKKVVYGETGVTYYIDNVPYQVDKLRYHLSWDALKPVIDKILKEIAFKTEDECTKDEWYIYQDIAGMYIGVDIAQAHHYVVEYLKWKWHNERNKDKETT